nr:ATP-grasp domain-containing protein [Gemmatimonadota bacterium]
MLSGYAPFSVDAYGDLDLEILGPSVALGRGGGEPYSARAAAQWAASLGAPLAAYGSDLENDPQAVAELARRCELLGNPPEILERVRDPLAVFAALSVAGLPVPETILASGGRVGSRAESTRPPTAWLRKPRAGGGGRGIRRSSGEERPREAEMLQELLEGPSIGLAFLADGRTAQPLALSLALEDRIAFGARDFAYVGSLSSLPDGSDEPDLREQATRAADAV